MAVTELTLVALAAVATMLSVGLLTSMDEPTRVILGFAGSICWGLVALSSFDVLVPATGSPPSQITVTPFVYLGFGFAIIVGVLSLLQLMRAVGSETGATEGSGLIE